MNPKTSFASADSAAAQPRCQWLGAPLRGAVAACLLAQALGFSTPALAAAGDASRLFEEAQQRFDRGDYAGAAIQLKNSIAANRNQIAAHVLLAKALVAKGDFAAAEAAFAEALNQGAARSAVMLPLARLYMSTDQPGKAAALLDPSIISGPEQAEAWAVLGSAYDALRNTREAERAFAQARATGPDALVVTLEEVPLLLRTGQDRRAQEAVAKAQALAPQDDRVWTMSAVVARHSGDLQAALAAFDRAVTLAPARRYEARMGRAALLLDIGRAADAAKDMAVLAEVAPNDLRALALRATAARFSGDRRQARELFKSLSDKLDALPPAWVAAREKFSMMAAVAYYEIGQPEKALTALGNVLAQSPQNFAARSLQATIRLERGEFARARLLLEALGRQAGEHPVLLYQRGLAELGSGRHTQALVTLQAAATAMPTLEVRRALATAQLRAGMPDRGLAGLEQIFAADKDPIAGRQLVTYHLEAGQPRKAVAVADAMAARWKEDVRVLDLLGSVRAAAGDNAGAREAYGRVLQRQPQNKVALLNLVKLDTKEGKFEAGLARMATLLQAGDADALFEKGALELAARQPDRALQTWRRLIDLGGADNRPVLAYVNLLLRQRRADEAQQVAKEASLKRPQDMDLRLAVARSMLAAGRVEPARVELREAASLADQDPDDLLRVAQLQLQAGIAANAAHSLEKALQARPGDLGALSLAVTVAVARNDLPEAEKQYGELARRHPQHAETAAAAAAIALARRQYPAAIAAYRKALQLQPNSALVLLLGRAMMTSQDPKGATQVYRDWLKTRPDDQPVQRALAEALMQSDQLLAARDAFRKALLAEPGDPQLLNNLAHVLLGMKDGAGAMEAAKAAVKADSANPAYQTTLARAHMAQGQADVALPLLRDARLRAPQYVPVRWNMVLALQQLGRREEARRELAELLQLQPALGKMPEAVRARAELGL
jgi:putative PEP-CTERM system TPR-repeat lipoprotein